MGTRLQHLRLAAGMSQAQLALAARVPVGTIRNWEQDRRVPLFDTAARVATALGVSLDVLAGQFREVGRGSTPAAGGKPGKARAVPQDATGAGVKAEAAAGPRDAPQTKPEGGKPKGAGGAGRAKMARGKKPAGG